MTNDRDPWAPYDALIEGVPDDVAVRDWALGAKWCYVDAECGTGIAMTLSGGPGPLRPKTTPLPSLKQAARLAKSWNMQDASLGVAALNAWYARRELLDSWKATYQTDTSERRAAGWHDPARRLEAGMEGKRVCVIGHFPHVYRLAERCAKLTVLERAPREADLPDTAAEFVLPEQDIVIATGTTLTNKTFVRIAELTRNATFALVGPSVVPAPALFDFGVDALGSRVVDDPERARFVVKNGNETPFGTAIVRVAIYRGEPTDTVQTL